FIVQGLALWNMSHLNTQMDFDAAAMARMYQAIALPFLFVPTTNAAYVGLKAEDSNQASALMNVSRNLGGTFGISFVQNLLATREQVHQAQYVERLNGLNPAYTSSIKGLSGVLTQHGFSAADAG